MGGVFQRRIEFLWLIFLMNVSLGWIQCKCLKWFWMSGRAWWEYMGKCCQGVLNMWRGGGAALPGGNGS